MAEYNAQKSYEWSTTEEFPLKGIEFQELLNGIRQKLSTPEAQEILYFQSMYMLLEAKLKQGVEEGKIKEVETKEPTN